MGILNRTPDSFYDRGATWEFDAFLRARRGAGRRRRRPARRRRREGRARVPRSGEAEELDRVVPADRGAPRALRRAGLGRHLAGVGARRRVRRRRGRRQRHLRVRRPRLPARSRRSTARPSSPRTSACGRASPTPNRTTTTWSATSPRSCSNGPGARKRPGWRPSRSSLDAGLDLGKSPAQSAVLLRESAVHAALGYPLLLSASNKRFVGELLDRADRRPARRVARRGRVRRAPRLPDRPRARRARIREGVPHARSHARDESRAQDERRREHALRPRRRPGAARPRGAATSSTSSLGAEDRTLALEDHTIPSSAAPPAPTTPARRSGTRRKATVRRSSSRCSPRSPTRCRARRS